MYRDALHKLLGYPCWMCGSRECAERTEEYNKEYGTYYDCLGSCYP